jgi:quercetin dioxygenase-like cupin family protein
MPGIFAKPIRDLPEADIPLEGVKAYLSQSDAHQVIFMEFTQEVDLPEHAHAAQVGFVLEGKIELTIGGSKSSYTKGDRYYIPEGVPHSGKIHAGYADITFFEEPMRYAQKEECCHKEECK